MKNSLLQGLNEHIDNHSDVNHVKKPTMAGKHAELLALAQKVACCKCRNEIYGGIRLVNSFFEGVTEVFGDYLTKTTCAVCRYK